MSLFLNALNGVNKEGRPPLWMMRQAGRYLPEYRKLREKYDFLELASRPELILEVTRQPIERFGLDAAILFSDILMVLRCFSVPFHFEEGRGPIIETPGNLKTLEYIPPSVAVPFVAEGVKEIKKHIEKPLIGFAGAPFTVATYLIEGGSFRKLDKTGRLLFKDRVFFKELLEKLTRATIDYLKLQIDAGVDALQLFDSWAGLLSYEDFVELILPSYRQILDGLAVHRKKEIPLILFCKGSFALVQEAAKLPFSGVSLDTHVSLKFAKEVLPSHLAIQGNLDPELLAHGSSEMVVKAATKLLKEMGDSSRYIFNLGHGILPSTPLETVYRLVETVKKWSEKK